ncbi:hypothetical protein [Undibacterium sp. Ren11W]|uniref:hypothetical protein n=1 Tax=Undibacterium sp. Ren11W TaxID=3413045 RepID=UPI003BEFEBC7
MKIVSFAMQHQRQIIDQHALVLAELFKKVGEDLEYFRQNKTFAGDLGWPANAAKWALLQEQKTS